MTVFLLMSLTNALLSVGLAFISIQKLKQIHDTLKNQIIGSTVFIALAMAVLHSISAIEHQQYGVTDVIEGAWRIVDMLAIIILIRLIGNIKE